jgi:hypothetical protein
MPSNCPECDLMDEYPNGGASSVFGENETNELVEPVRCHIDIKKNARRVLSEMMGAKWEEIPQCAGK